METLTKSVDEQKQAFDELQQAMRVQGSAMRETVKRFREQMKKDSAERRLWTENSDLLIDRARWLAAEMVSQSGRRNLYDACATVEKLVEAMPDVIDGQDPPFANFSDRFRRFRESYPPDPKRLPEGNVLELPESELERVRRFLNRDYTDNPTERAGTLEYIKRRNQMARDGRRAAKRQGRELDGSELGRIIPETDTESESFEDVVKRPNKRRHANDLELKVTEVLTKQQTVPEKSNESSAGTGGKGPEEEDPEDDVPDTISEPVSRPPDKEEIQAEPRGTRVDQQSSKAASSGEPVKDTASSEVPLKKRVPQLDSVGASSRQKRRRRGNLPRKSTPSLDGTTYRLIIRLPQLAAGARQDDGRRDGDGTRTASGAGRSGSATGTRGDRSNSAPRGNGNRTGSGRLTSSSGGRTRSTPPARRSNRLQGRTAGSAEICDLTGDSSEEDPASGTKGGKSGKSGKSEKKEGKPSKPKKK